MSDQRTLVGRAPQLALLTHAVGGLTEGRSAVVLIEGPAGIGKTALLHVALDSARAAGIRVFLGGADELARSLPMGPLLEALGCTVNAPDPERAHVASLVRDGSGLQSAGFEVEDWLLGAVVESVVGLVESEAQRGPLLLAIEDLHWADRPTRQALLAIVRRLSHLPLALVATSRPATGPDHDAVRDGFRREGATIVAVGALEQDPARALVADLVSAEPGPRLMAKVGGAGGNPLFITELVHALVDEGSIATRDGIADATDESLPPTLRQTILQRLSMLSEADLDLLRHASLLGATFSLHHLAIVAGVTESEMTDHIRGPLTAGVIVAEGERMRFRHELVRDAIYQDIPFEIRSARHRDVARALSAAGGAPVQVAPHWMRGARDGDEDAVRGLWTAAQQVRATDLQAAGEMLTRASELLDDEVLRERFFLLPIEAAYAAKDLGHAEHYLRAGLAQRLEPVAEARHRTILARILEATGHRREAGEEIERCLAIQDLPPDTRGRVLHGAAKTLIARAEFEAADRIGQQVFDLGHDENLPEIMALSSLARAWCAIGLGEAERALALIDSARATNPQVSVDVPGQGSFRPFEIGTQLAVRVGALVELDRFDEARAQLVEAARLAVHWTWQPLIHGMLGKIMFLTARWDDAVAVLEVALGEGPSRVGGSALSATVRLAVIALHRDQLDAAEHLVERAAREGSSGGPQWGLDILEWARAQVTEAREGPEAALPRLRETWGALNSLRFDFRMQAPEAIRLALAAKDRAFAETVMEDMDAFASRAGNLPSIAGNLAWCRGLLAVDADELCAAVDLMRQSPRVYERARCAEDAARVLARIGRADEARKLFDEALVVYEDIDAARLIARAAAAMREHGMRRGPRGKRGRPTFGWDALTPTEAQIAVLAADGMRNADIGGRLFISPHTVRTHLRHVYTKLQINTRVELANEVAKHPEPARV